MGGNKLKIGNLPEKIKNKNNDSEDDPGSQKQNEEYARNIYQRPQRTKEWTEKKNMLEQTDSRMTEAEWKHVHVCTSIYHITLLDPQTVCNYFILLGQTCFHYGLQL